MPKLIYDETQVSFDSELHAIHEITVKKGSGTGFILKYGNTFYLVTAKHVVVSNALSHQKKITLDINTGLQQRC